MPYNADKELPQSVKDALPSEEAQSVFRETLNKRLSEGKSEAVAAASAWSALKRAGYEKRQIDDDVYTTEMEAAARSVDMGYEGETHTTDTGDGQKVYMPGESHEEYLEQEEPEEAGSDHSRVMGAIRVIMQAVMGKREPTTEFKVASSIAKVNEEKRLVSGWASVIEEDGEPVEDRQGDVISEEELEKAAHKFVSDYRASKAMHKGDQIGTVVDSMVFTKEQQEALGINLGKTGWYITMKIDDDEAWEKVKKGEFQGFSIGGKAKRNAN